MDTSDRFVSTNTISYELTGCDRTYHRLLKNACATRVWDISSITICVISLILLVAAVAAVRRWKAPGYTGWLLQIALATTGLTLVLVMSILATQIQTCKGNLNLETLKAKSSAFVVFLSMFLRLFTFLVLTSFACESFKVGIKIQPAGKLSTAIQLVAYTLAAFALSMPRAFLHSTDTCVTSSGIEIHSTYAEHDDDWVYNFVLSELSACLYLLAFSVLTVLLIVACVKTVRNGSEERRMLVQKQGNDFDALHAVCMALALCAVVLVSEAIIATVIFDQLNSSFGFETFHMIETAGRLVSFIGIPSVPIIMHFACRDRQ